MFRFFLFGSIFGFVLSKSGATDYTRIEEMFLLRDLHLFGVIGVAIAVTGIGMFLLKRFRAKGAGGVTLSIQPKPRKRGNLWGGLLFGAGWALTGTCPGTALAQIGEGKLTAFFTVFGIFLGTQVYRLSTRRSALSASANPPLRRVQRPATER